MKTDSAMNSDNRYHSWTSHVAKCYAHYLLLYNITAFVIFPALFMSGFKVRPEWSVLKWTALSASVLPGAKMCLYRCLGCQLEIGSHSTALHATKQECDIHLQRPNMPFLVFLPAGGSDALKWAKSPWKEKNTLHSCLLDFFLRHFFSALLYRRTVCIQQ